MKLRSARLVGSIAVSATLGLVCLLPYAGAEPGAPDPEANFVDSSSKTKSRASSPVADLGNKVFSTDEILEKFKNGKLPINDPDKLSKLVSGLACQVKDWEAKYKTREAQLKKLAEKKLPADLQIKPKQETQQTLYHKTLAVADPKTLGALARAKIEGQRTALFTRALIDARAAALQKKSDEAQDKAKKDIQGLQRASGASAGYGSSVPNMELAGQMTIREMEAELEQKKAANATKKEIARLEKLTFEQLTTDPSVKAEWESLRSSGSEKISQTYKDLEKEVEAHPALAYRILNKGNQDLLGWMDTRANDWLNYQQTQIRDGAAGRGTLEALRHIKNFGDEYHKTVSAILRDSEGGKKVPTISKYNAELNNSDVKIAKLDAKTAEAVAWQTARHAVSSGMALAVASVATGGAAAPLMLGSLGLGAWSFADDAAHFNPLKEASFGTALENVSKSPELKMQGAFLAISVLAPATKVLSGSQKIGAFESLAARLYPSLTGAKLTAAGAKLSKIAAGIDVVSENYFGYLSAVGAMDAIELCKHRGESPEAANACNQAIYFSILDAVTQAKQTKNAFKDFKMKLASHQACHFQVAKGADAPVKDDDAATKPAGLGQKLKDLGNTPITVKGIREVLAKIPNMNAKVKTQLGRLLAKASPQQLKRFQEWADKFSQKIARKTKAEQEKAWDDSVTSCLGKKGAVAKVDRDIIEVGGKIIFLSDNASYLPQAGEGI